MKNVTRIAGIIAMIAVIGLLFTACGNGTTGGGGVTIDSQFYGKWRCDDVNWEDDRKYGPITVEITASTVTITYENYPSEEPPFDGESRTFTYSNFDHEDIYNGAYRYFVDYYEEDGCFRMQLNGSNLAFEYSVDPYLIFRYDNFIKQ